MLKMEQFIFIYMKCRTLDLIGIHENDLIELEDRNKFITHKNGKIYILNQNNDKKFSVGHFETPTIGELKKMVGSMIPLSASVSISKSLRKECSLCSFEIETGVDVGYLQSQLKTKDKAMVQVASNFNCLENSGRHFPANQGSLVDVSSLDATQGPGAVFGPLSAYLYRAHFVFPGFKGQNPERQINLLDNVKKYTGIPINGKFTLNGGEKQIAENDIDKIVDKIEVGLHQDVPVIFGRNGRTNVYELGPKYQKIDQCFTASINTFDYGKQTTDEHLNIITRTLLRAAYQSTYLSAISRGSRILYLTLVGGGSFSNPHQLIIEELMEAHKMWANHPASKLNKVVLCVFTQRETQIVQQIIDVLKGNMTGLA